MASMRSDAAILGDVPDFVRFDAMLKATPAEDGGRRILYFEASNEDVDHQGEIVVQKALADSADYFLRHGNIDLSHYTIMGPKSGLANFMEFEIGRPIEARVDGKRTFVKAELYQGDSPQARNASMVWDSLTKQQPASRWYPSVGGAVLAKSVRFDPALRRKVAVIEKVRWNNVALDRCPVNRTVGEVSAAPLGTFAKSLGGFVLQAGYGTDVSTLDGGAALRKQSLDGRLHAYTAIRNRLAADLRSRKVAPRRASMLKALRDYGLDSAAAEATVECFLDDLATGLRHEENR